FGIKILPRQTSCVLRRSQLFQGAHDCLAGPDAQASNLTHQSKKPEFLSIQRYLFAAGWPKSASKKPATAGNQFHCCRRK
ncbi:MAG: hypothetical protein ACTHY3_00815, partial [Glutamicibacter ardleyensis]